MIGLPQLEKRLDPARLRAALAPALEAAGSLVEVEAKAKAPHDIGTLKRSIRHQPLGDFAMQVGTNLAYAPFVHGFMDETKPRTKPHWPPLAAVAGWAARHGMNPYLVARAIALRGTPLVPFLKQARDDNRPRIVQMLHDAVRRFAGGG